MRRSSSHEGTGKTEFPRNLCPSGCKETNKKTESVDGGINDFLKQNYNKYIKGRALFDGIKHQEKFNKQKDYSPTVAADSVILTEAVNAHEGWYMVTFDLPKVYVHTETDYDVIILME